MPEGQAHTVRQGAGPRRLRRARADEGGQALVEFAIVVPVVLLVIFAILKFGVLYNNYIQLTNAADAGARLFSIERGQANPCSDVVAQVDSTAATLNNATLIVGMSAYSSATATSLSTWSSSAATSTCPWATANSGLLVSGDTATLTASYPWDLSFLGLKIFLEHDVGLGQREHRMSRPDARFGRWCEQTGQVVPLVAIALLVFIGMMGLVIDVGQLHVVQRKLQIAADAAALAGAAQLSTSTTAATTASDDYDGTAPNLNGLSGFAVTTTVEFGCLSSTTVPARAQGMHAQQRAEHGLLPAVLAHEHAELHAQRGARVIESTSVNPLFMGALGIGAESLSATATASETGGIPEPNDIEMIDDTTRSMDSGDTCTPTGITANGSVPTQEDCAKEGIAFLLATLLPCSTELHDLWHERRHRERHRPDRPRRHHGLPRDVRQLRLGHDLQLDGQLQLDRGARTSSGCSTADYNDISGSTTYYDYSTSHYMSNATGWYSNYQVVPFESDYRTSDSTSSTDSNNPWLALNTSSSLVKATWWYQCGSHAFPGDSGGDEQYGIQDPGGEGTYYGDAILQAKNSFASAGRSGVHDAIILLSDGDATSSSSDLKYASLDTNGQNECQAGITAAEAAENAGIEFFSIAYGANNGGCSTDTSNSTTCNATTFTDCSDDSAICTMELMADNHVTNPSYANDYQAEQALCGSSSTFPSNPTYHFFNTPTGSAFESAFQSVGNQLTSSGRGSSPTRRA